MQCFTGGFAYVLTSYLNFYFFFFFWGDVKVDRKKSFWYFMPWCALNLILYQCNFIYSDFLEYRSIFNHCCLIFDPNSFTDQQIGGFVIFLFAFPSQGCRLRRSLQVEYSLDDYCLRDCLQCLYVYYSVSPPEWILYLLPQGQMCFHPRFICTATWIWAQTWEIFAVGITCTYFKVSVIK